MCSLGHRREKSSGAIYCLRAFGLVLGFCHSHPRWQDEILDTERFEMKRVVPLLAVIMVLGALASVAKAQSAAGAGYSFGDALSPHPNATRTQLPPVPSYKRP